MDSTPTVYILHGEDEYAIANTIRDFEARLGDPVYASLNITRLDGGTFQPDQLLSIAGAMPFLAKRRLVIVTNGMGKFKQEDAQKKFLADLEKLPPTSAVLLAENHLLTSYKDQRRNKIHWLEVWARDSPKDGLYQRIRVSAAR